MVGTTRHTTIIESADGARWLWAQQDRKFGSLAAAIKADDLAAARIADTIGGKVVTLREIIPNTRVGRLIAKALTAVRPAIKP